MSLRKTKLFKIIQTGTTEAILKCLWDYLKNGKDPNVRDEVTGGTLLHIIVENGDRFCTGQTVSGVYMLVCKDIDIDSQDNKGETALHKTMRIEGGFRILLALMRCGADSMIKNNDGKTPEEVLMTEKPLGWEENLHWYNKFKPGLWRALQEENPDKKLIEKLLKNWCRVTTVKKGTVTSMKSLVQSDIHKHDILKLLEKYENTNELALATTAGMGFIVRMWVKQGIVNNMDVNTRDHSYQFKWIGYPCNPRPLVSASWETGNYETVDVIMDLNPDMRVLWTPDPDGTNPAKPLFFQLFCGSTKVKDERIIQRVLRGCDLTARDRDGQNILHVAIQTDQSENNIRFLLANGVDIAARDCQGRTPRDLAEKCNKPLITRCIDEYVIKMVKDKKFDQIEKLILHNYDHILDLTEGNRTLVEIAKKSNTRIHEVVQLTAPIQAYTKKVFKAAEDGALEELRKLLSCKKYAEVRDRCGRSPLHRAILHGKEAVARFLVENFSQLIPARDSLDRTPLHYANLFMEKSDIVNDLQRNGADSALCDAMGRSASFYRREECGAQVFQQLQKEVRDFDMNIYLAETDFDGSFHEAIRKGDIETVKSLVSGLTSFGEMAKYSSVLFDCVDNRQLEIARFLITSGFKTDIWKQYNYCDPNDQMCAMMECGHSTTSLRDRAQELKLEDIVKMIDAAVNGKLQLRMNKQNGVKLNTYVLS
ncbi:hypothetical protein ACJMK2_043971 [Sinanodonta woodiana]|uniref:Uncharacterized protein n=1 Tax=Sinanodonta woodiana TaxID=1069815 RepID=A0ABD3VYK1_SINWO